MVDEAIYLVKGTCVQASKRSRVVELEKENFAYDVLLLLITWGAATYHLFKTLQEWRRRYFILKGSKLFYCKNEVSKAVSNFLSGSCRLQW